MFRTLKPLILASGSPRRKRLLLSVGVRFEVYPSGIDESASTGEPAEAGQGPVEAAEYWARLKAESVSSVRPDSWILGADTVVVVDGAIFGKPSSAADAVWMLERLSGRIHEVITGMSLVRPGGQLRRSGSVVTRVRFKSLSTGEIEAYVRTGEPMDKAGAYGIQESGAFLVKSIGGSYTNVVGLPLCECLDWLSTEKIIEPG
jgi:septum formation protein